MPHKNILLICWDYPPNNGIGGRRWAKLSKYLVQLGYEVHVIKSEPIITKGNSPWIKDVESPSIKVYNIKPAILVSWLHGATTSFKKIKYSIAHKLLPYQCKGTIYDKAIGIEKELISKAKELIEKHQLSNVIVTGAPFNLMYYTAKLLQQYPRITSIADYRDPWLTAENYGMKGLSVERKKTEEEKQNVVFNQFTYISAPNSFLLEEIKNTYTGKLPYKSKFIEIEHAFDADDYKLIKPSLTPTAAQQKIKIVYGGALYIGVESYIQKLSEAVTNIQELQPDKIIEIIFYTDDYKRFNNLYSNLIFKPSIGDDFFSVLTEANYLLIVLAEHNKNFKTTKYYEYMPFHKPFLYIGPQGFVSDSITQEGIGVVLTNFESDLKNILFTKEEVKTANPNSIDTHSFKSRVNYLSSLLN